MAMKELVKKDPEKQIDYERYSTDVDRDMAMIMGTDATMYPNVQEAHGRR
jgi:hypothetical protein